MKEPTTNRIILGAKLRSERLRSGFTQKEAAEKLGITQPQLSMLESGKRRLSAELAASLFDLYQCEDDILPAFYEDVTYSGCMKTARFLRVLAKKSGSENLASAVDNYISLCCYILLRKLYAVNPHNSGKIFGIKEEDMDRLCELLADEPDRLAAFAENSAEVRASEIEPDVQTAAEFMLAVRACEKEIGRALKKG